MRLRLLQICNVGQIVGGTAACAWTVCRALPECEHHVWFLSSIDAATRDAFAGCQLEKIADVNVTKITALKPDIVFLHNTSRQKIVGDLRECRSLSINYLHSRIEPAEAARRVYCSEFLRNEYADPGGCILYQGVPLPEKRFGERTGEEIVVGRLCTPTIKKWPGELVNFYRDLSSRHPEISWEFVGAPARIKLCLEDALKGRCQFHEAGWEQRSQLWQWTALLHYQPGVTESFGRTVSEAMRCGCLPIVDRRGGFCEQVDASNGFLCDQLDEFHVALSKLANSVLANRLSEAAELVSNQRFSVQGFRERLLQLFSTH